MLGPVHGLSGTNGIVAVAAAAVALIALLACLVLLARLHRLRSAQRVILGDGERDLVSHAAELTGRFDELTRYSRGALSAVEDRMGEVEARMDHAIAYRAVVRYDAYGEMSGRQSTSIALLDATGSGVIVSSIHHRDQARLYTKQVRRGVPDLQLSPEEEEAIRLALAGEGDGDGEPPGGAAAA